VLEGAVFKASILSIAIALGFAEAQAGEASIAINCIPIPEVVPEVGSRESDPIVAVEVRVAGDSWRVSHISARGFKYERTLQYNLRDTSVPGAPSWVGNYYSSPNLRMTGQIINQRGQLAYVEELYDSRGNNSLVASTRVHCTTLSTPQLNPVVTQRFDFDRNQVGPREDAVSLRPDGCVFTVPGTISDQITLDFIVDSGASDVSIPKDVVSTLVRTRTITDADFLGSETYRLADGSTVPSQRLVIRSLKVGSKVLENVTAHIAPDAGQLLLGQSFLRRLKSWSIDNGRSALILNGDPIPVDGDRNTADPLSGLVAAPTLQ
jgi:clan AA aspartic protease (TIGR02281 family)